MDAIVVIGGGGHARVVLSVLRKLRRYRIVGYTDPRDCGEILGASYLGMDDELPALAVRHRPLHAALGVGQIGTGEARIGLWTRLRSLTLSFPAIVSPDAVVNEGVSVGDAAVIMDGVVINTGAKIGLGAILNTNATIEHDVTIADWVHVASGVTISGGVTVGRSSMIGVGAAIIEGKTIAEGCFVGAGATVVQDLPEPGVYVGCPARRIR